MLQVQRDQHDAQQFWLALLDAVRQATGADSGAEPPAATPGFNAPAMAGRVLSELAEARSRVTLVIDDLHELTSPEALAQLTRLLTNLPPHVHAIVSTRHDVRLGLHQLRLADELAEIRAADLRFSERETRELLDARVSRCRRRGWRWCTGGLRGGRRACGSRRSPWPVTPTRSGSSPSSPAATARSRSTCSPRCSSASRPSVQDLLLRTSLLDRVNGELADLLTGRPGSERILLDLEDANAFTESLDPGRTWFRDHHLLADFLRLELRLDAARGSTGAAPAGRAVVYPAGQSGRRGPHTQAAGDWADAARLLADHAFSLTLDGQAQTMQALLQAFPPGADHPGAGPGARDG